MAERTGVEPACPYGRRFSRPLHYQLCDLSANSGNKNIAESFLLDKSKRLFYLKLGNIKIIFPNFMT